MRFRENSERGRQRRPNRRTEGGWQRQRTGEDEEEEENSSNMNGVRVNDEGEVRYRTKHRSCCSCFLSAMSPDVACAPPLSSVRGPLVAWLKERSEMAAAPSNKLCLSPNLGLYPSTPFVRLGHNNCHSSPMHVSVADTVQREPTRMHCPRPHVVQLREEDHTCGAQHGRRRQRLSAPARRPVAGPLLLSTDADRLSAEVAGIHIIGVCPVASRRTGPGAREGVLWCDAACSSKEQWQCGAKWRQLPRRRRSLVQYIAHRRREVGHRAPRCERCSTSFVSAFILRRAQQTAARERRG